YGSYLGLEDVVIDAYWLFIRDDESGAYSPAFPDIDLHTVGLRGSGTIGAFDFEAEVAYQFGEADLPNFLWWDNDFDYDAFGVNLELGYTFDASWQPRIYLGFAWLEGADDSNSWPLGVHTYDDLSFNRIFSNWEYTEFIENTDLSNVFVYRAGLSAQPTESLSLLLALTYFQVDEPREAGWWFWKWTADEDLGLEAGLYADYQYSEDLVFRAGYAHFFADDGIADLNLINSNGLVPHLGDKDDNYHYLFVETEISF
ncbi:MAG TPA: alginate export family protein, partial [Candidatus Hydrogenedentes bacterium]|nr:alginate export family protein [Candidatus Hydrogenedentota bacterium]